MCANDSVHRSEYIHASGAYMLLTYRYSLPRLNGQFDTDLDLAVFGIGWMLGSKLRD